MIKQTYQWQLLTYAIERLRDVSVFKAGNNAIFELLV